MKLTLKAIERLECEPGQKDKLVFDSEQRGLAVRVTASGGKNFLAQYTLAGGKRRIPLGECSAISLDTARKATAAILSDVAQGRDPAGARKDAAREAKRKAEHEELTLDALLEQWATIYLVDRRESYATRAVRAIRRAFAKRLKSPAADLSRNAVVHALDELTKDGKAAMAARTAAYGSACYKWALKRGSLSDNPFVNLPVAATVSRERVLTDLELRAIWHATSEPGTFNAIVRALILTGQRREEVAGMTWGEIDAQLSTWTIPASRAKNGVAHLVPLSPQVRAIVEAARPTNPDAAAVVFPGRHGPYNSFGNAKAALDEASGVTDWRLHDIRRTMATGLQKLGVRLEVTESCLNHISGSRGGLISVYQKHDYAPEKRVALTAWGEHVAAIVEGREAEGNVTQLRKSA
jgi:integrase